MLETHFSGGAYYPRGGSSSIAKCLVAAIERRGGHVLVRAPVAAIDLDARTGAARGVVCKETRVRVRAGVVSDAGATGGY